MKLLDTDTCIAILRQHPRAVARFRETSDELALSMIAVAELFFGAHASRHAEKNLERVTVLLEQLTALGVERAAAERFGAIKADLRKRGEIIPDFDILIGAVALSNDATLVTHNLRHFQRIPGLVLEDWMGPV